MGYTSKILELWQFGIAKSKVAELAVGRLSGRRSSTSLLIMPF